MSYCVMLYCIIFSHVFFRVLKWLLHYFIRYYCFYDFLINEISDIFLLLFHVFPFLFFLLRFAFESVVKVLREEAQAAPQ
jgi:hypothetical protein